MQDQAYMVLELPTNADGRSVEAAYWRRAKAITSRQAFCSADADELDRVNAAYAALAGDFRTQVRRGPRLQKRSWLPRLALAVVLAGLIGGGVYGGTTYREEIRDRAVWASEEAERGWDESIGWLQGLDEETNTGQPASTAP